MSETTQSERLIDKTLRIDAPADAVWAALTDPQELVRWFPLEAEVEPGVGGTILLSWGNRWRGRHDIQIWEPGRHLQTNWPVESEVEGKPAEETLSGPDEARSRLSELTVDYHIEAEGGATTLRLVHTGFGKGAEWDDWYDGIRRGWDYELECLRHYLENHHGQERHVAWARRSISRTGTSAFDAVFGPDGLLTTGSIAGIDLGAPYALKAFDGTEIRGNVLVNDTGGQFAGTFEGLNNGCFRVESFSHGDTQEINIFISTWDVPEDQVRDMESRWQQRLEQLYA